MSHTTLHTGPPFQDAIGARLRVALVASLLLNIALWSMAASVARHPPAYDPRPVEITRVILPPERKIVKVIPPKPIKKIEVKKKVAPPPKPRPPEPRHTPPPPQPLHTVQRKPPKPIQVARLPQGAHSRVITAKPDKTAPPPTPTDHTALAGGNAPQGQVIDKQQAGNAAVNPPGPVAKAPDPAPAPKAEVKPAPAPVTPAPVAKAPEPAPEPKPAPAPEPKPKRKGPSREAEATDEVKPEIPDSLKQQGGYKSFVRVRVVIEPDGTATTVLRTSSGNPDIDSRVLEALKKWKWKPALKDGVAVQSTQLFKFEFEVE
jgi:protein TonB